MATLPTDHKNATLRAVAAQLDARRADIIAANRADLDAYPDPSDRAMVDRLVCDDAKVDAMIGAVEAVLAQADPVGVTLSEVERPNGLRVVNRTAPFGTILIIYESRPDVTIEAAVLAFKAGSTILLKGGKEAVRTNRVLVDCWHAALRQNDLPTDLVRLLTLDRTATQAFLRDPPEPLDLIVPRGGERLIAFVKEHATCAVLVSGRGNNFCYVHAAADVEMAERIVLEAKTDKISACNALDKVLIDRTLPDFAGFARRLCERLAAAGVSVLADGTVRAAAPGAAPIADEGVWDKEFLALRIAVGAVEGLDGAVARINRHSGKHSATIVTAEEAVARAFMEGVDCAAVYHNASTRFTDGGHFGAGAELAISTDKLHHRGPLGLQQLVTNKYWVYGSGQVRGAVPVEETGAEVTG